MTIPSPEEFAEPSIKTIGMKYSGEGWKLPTERDSVISFLEVLVERRKERRKEIRESSVAKWFYKQSCANKAKRKIYGSESEKPSEQEWIADRANWLLEANRDWTFHEVQKNWGLDREDQVCRILEIHNQPQQKGFVA